MYAIVEVGAKQFNIKKDDIIQVEKMDGEVGKDIALENVLLVCDGDKVEIGQPFVKGAKVKAEVMEPALDDKKISHKYRRRKASHWTKGNRQKLTVLKIKEIKA